MKRLLAVKLADLGDLLSVTPALRALRNGHPEAHIAALVTPSSAAILAGSTSVDEVLPFEKALFDRPLAAPRSAPAALALARQLRGGSWDALALFHHLTTPFGVAKYAALALASGAPIRAGLDNGRGWFLTRRVRDDGFGARHEVDYWLQVAEALGGYNADPRLEIRVTAADRAWATAALANVGLRGRDVAIVHPGTGAFSLARRWPVERFAAVARELRGRYGFDVAVVRGPAPDEDALARQVASEASGASYGLPVVGPTPTLGALVALLGQARVFVGNDSGVMHLATAARVPVVAIFGPSNDRAWGPYPPTAPRHAIVREQLACTPCTHRGHQFGTPAGCPARTCLDLVEPADVLAAIDRVLRATGEARAERNAALIEAH